MDVAAVVLDLDQTLFDHEGSARDGLATWLGGMGIGVSDALVDAWFDAEERHTTAWRAGECSWAEQRRRRLRDVLPLAGLPCGDDATLDAVFQGYLAAYGAAWRPFDDARPCVAGLAGRGYRLAVLTNGAEEQQRAKLAAIGLDGAFEVVLTAEALGVGKPDPHAYEAVCSALDLPAAQCLHVGDNLALDVVAPRAAGMRAVHLDRAGRAGGDVVTSLWGLLDLLDGGARIRPSR